MKRYDSYKDSGVEWIGEIPSHWDLLKIRHVIESSRDGIKIGPFGSSLTGKVGTSDLPYKVYGQWNIINSDFTAGGSYVSEETFKELCAYEIVPNDVLISMMGTVGKCAVIPVDIQKGIMDSHVVKVRLDSRIIDSRFFYYIYDKDNSAVVISNIQRVKKGSIMDGLNSSVIKNLYLCLPSLKEQQNIAAYLDVKCSKIDNVIETQEKRVELLRELKQSIITRAVTRGINSDAKLKDSGVEWIGEIPEHWEVMKMNNVCKVITDFVASGSFADLRNNVQYLDEPDYALLVRTADLSQKNKDVQPVYVSKDSYEFLSNSNLYGGEIILPNIGASIGDVYMVPNNLYDKMTLGPNAILLRTKYNDKFFYYYFMSKGGRESLVLMGQAAAQSKFNKTELRQMKVILPPLNEQNSIVQEIENKIKPADNAITKALRQIELLKEYKQSLITEVVTGKRKVC